MTKAKLELSINLQKEHEAKLKELDKKKKHIKDGGKATPKDPAVHKPKSSEKKVVSEVKPATPSVKAPAAQLTHKVKSPKVALTSADSFVQKQSGSKDVLQELAEAEKRSQMYREEMQAEEENEFNSDLLVNEEKAIRKVRDAEK